MQVSLPKKEFLDKMYGLSQQLEKICNQEQNWQKFIAKVKEMLYPLNQDREVSANEHQVGHHTRKIQINTKIGTERYGWSQRTRSFSDQELFEVMQDQSLSRVVYGLLQQTSKQKLWQEFCGFARKFSDKPRNSMLRIKKKPITLKIDTYDGVYAFTTAECMLPAASEVKFMTAKKEAEPKTEYRTAGKFRQRVINYFGYLNFDFQTPTADVNVLRLIKKLNKTFNFPQIFKQKIATEKSIIAQNQSVYEQFKERYLTTLMANAI